MFTIKCCRCGKELGEAEDLVETAQCMNCYYGIGEDEE